MANSCKYYKQVLQVSYDSGVTWVNVGETRKGDLYDYESMQCGGGVTQYRWVDVTGQYTCDGTTKYQKTKKQYSNDGTTWQDVSPAEYGKGDVIEYQSEDCGYEPPSYSGEYLTFVAIDDGRFKFNDNHNGNKVKYSLDEGSTWSTLDNDAYSPTVYAGQKIMWKGEFESTGTYGVGKFSSTGRFNIEGNVMSLLYGDNFEGQTSLAGYTSTFELLFNRTSVVDASRLCLPATTLAWGCYAHMFENCTSLTTAPELPATTLVERCYQQMFYNCTSLTTAPELPATTLTHACYSLMFYGCTSLTSAPTLPATTLADFCYNFMFTDCTSLANIPNDLLPATTLARCCYYAMFLNCTSLTTVPKLPATTLAYNCYNAMFSFCTSLTTAPELPATTLVEGCYEHMFRGSSKLNYIKCLATDISAENCTNEWLTIVYTAGTFVKASSMNDWTRGSSGIPNNWTIQNA